MAEHERVPVLDPRGLLRARVGRAPLHGSPDLPAGRDRRVERDHPRRRRRHVQHPAGRFHLHDHDHQRTRAAGAAGLGSPKRVRLVRGQLRPAERCSDGELLRQHPLLARRAVERRGEQLPRRGVPQTGVRGQRRGRSGFVRRRRHDRREGDSELLLRRRRERSRARLVRTSGPLQLERSGLRVLLIQ